MGIGRSATASEDVDTMVLQQRPEVGHQTLRRLMIPSVTVWHAGIGIEAHLQSKRCQLTDQWRHQRNIRHAIDANGIKLDVLR